MIAAVPKRSRIWSRAPSSTAPSSAPSGSESWQRQVGLEVGDRDADQRQAASVDRGLRRCEQAAGDGENDLRLCGRVPERVRARCTREVGEAKPKHHGPADAPRRAQPARDAIDERDEIGVDLLGGSAPPPERSLRADRAAATARPHRPAIDVVRERVQMARRTLGRAALPARPRRHGRARRLSMPQARSLSAVAGRRPTAARRAADAGTPALRRAARRAGRRAWRARSPPWQGTSCARRPR